MKKNGIRYRGFMIFYVIASIITSAAYVLMTRLRGDMGETALEGDTATLVRFLLILTGVAAVRAIFAVSSTLLSERFAGNAGHKIRRTFVDYFLRVPFSKFEKAGSGECLSLFTNDIPQAKQLIGGDWGGGMMLIADVIFFIAALVFMFITNPLLTLIVLGLVPILMFVQIFASKPIQRRAIVTSEERANFNAVVNDSLQNISTIATYGLEDVLEDRYLTQYDRFVTANINEIKALLPLVSVGILSTVIPLAAIFVIAGISVINGSMTLAEFIAYSGMLVLVGDFLGTLSENLGTFQVSVAGAKRLITQTADDLEDLNSGEVLSDVTCANISFKNVSFSYSEELPLALDNVSFEIKPGSRVAFVGGSGSGKSTILKLLLGLYEPNSGTINLAGKDTANISKAGIRDAFAYVPQDSFLFPESIRENITLESGVQDMSRLTKACADAGILDFINSIPGGFDSVLSESSENISGGQRQRIAMARAFYKNSPIILFDEATSALDPATEASILESFDNVAKGKTVIMVAHRTKAIAACDTIVVMDSGNISGIGSHDQLLMSNAVYRNLYESRKQEEGAVA